MVCLLGKRFAFTSTMSSGHRNGQIWELAWLESIWEPILLCQKHGETLRNPYNCLEGFLLSGETGQQRNRWAQNLECDVGLLIDHNQEMIHQHTPWLYRLCYWHLRIEICNQVLPEGREKDFVSGLPIPRQDWDISYNWWIYRWSSIGGRRKGTNQDTKGNGTSRTCCLESIVGGGKNGVGRKASVTCWCRYIWRRSR